MRVIPKTAFNKIMFFKAHLPHWADHAAEIGLSADDIVDLQSKFDVANAAFTAQQEAKRTAQGATAAFHDAAGALAKAGGSAILKIRGTASGDVSVYNLAQLDVPKKGSPIDAPGQPTQFSSALGGMGELMLKWKCKNPRNAEGTVYEIWRSVDGGESVFLGVAGKKQFTDYKLPPGTKKATYSVTAVRSTKRGDVGGYNVNFGVGPGHEAIIRVNMARAAA